VASRRPRLGDRLRRVEERRQILGRISEYRTADAHQKEDEGPPIMISDEETEDAASFVCADSIAPANSSRGAANANEPGGCARPWRRARAASWTRRQIWARRSGLDIGNGHR
jgi:hypothetical protein